MVEGIGGFEWTGLNKQGERVSGVIKAANVNDAQSELKKMGVEVIAINFKQQASLSFGLLSRRKNKITKKDILLFTRYLSMMLAAGLTLMQALDVIASDQEDPAFRSMINNIRSNVAEGKTLAESFNQYPEYFGELYCNLIKAGEKSGTLDKILLRLGDYLEKSEQLKRKIKKALVYPIAILTVALLVCLILLIFVVPQFQAMFASFGADLPLFTRMVVNLSNFMRTYWWLLAGFVGMLVYGLRSAMRQSVQLQDMKDQWLLRVYLIGPVLRKGIVARFARTLATTLEAGMPILECMRTMSPIMGNRLYSRAVVHICDDVVSGKQLSDSMSGTKLFPNMAIQMVSVGEASGQLSSMLNKVADYYEEDVSVVVDNLSSLMEPAIMVILGGIVGTFVVAMYLPIFQIGSLF